MVESNNIAVLRYDGIDVGGELDELQLSLVRCERRDGLAVRLRAPLDAEKRQLCGVVARAAGIVVRRANRHDGILEIILAVVIRDLDGAGAVLRTAERAFDGGYCRAPLAENLRDVPWTVNDDADIAAMWDDDRVADVGRLLRSCPALLRCVEEGVEAIARLFLAVLVYDLLVSIGRCRCPLLPIGIEAGGGVSGDDVLRLSRVDILETAAPVQDVVAGPDRVVGRPLFIVPRFRIVHEHRLARLPPVERRNAAAELVVCFDAQRNEHFVRSAVDAVDVACHDRPVYHALIPG